MFARLALFTLGGCGGVWLGYTYWFNVFEQTIWRLFWESIGNYGSGNMPSLESILESEIFMKTSVCFLLGGIALSLIIKPR